MLIHDKSPKKERNIQIAIRAAKGELLWKLAYEIGIDEKRTKQIITKYNRLAYQYAVLSSAFPLREYENIDPNNFKGDLAVKILEIYERKIKENPEVNNIKIPTYKPIDKLTKELLLNLSMAMNFKNIIHIDDNKTDLYKSFIEEIERALLESTLEFTKYNQTKAAEILGWSRNALRLKMKLYDLLD